MNSIKKFFGGLAGVIVGTLYYMALRTRNMGKTWIAQIDPFTKKDEIRHLPNSKWVTKAAVTFGKRIFVKTTPSTGLIRHEAVHCDQYRRWGFFGFLWRYGQDLLQYGYERSRIEQEARDKSGTR